MPADCPPRAVVRQFLRVFLGPMFGTRTWRSNTIKGSHELQFDPHAQAACIATASWAAAAMVRLNSVFLTRMLSIDNPFFGPIITMPPSPPKTQKRTHTDEHGAGDQGMGEPPYHEMRAWTSLNFDRLTGPEQSHAPTQTTGGQDGQGRRGRGRGEALLPGARHHQARQLAGQPCELRVRFESCRWFQGLMDEPDLA